MTDPPMTQWPEWVGDWRPVIERNTLPVAQHPVLGLTAMLDADPSLASPGSPLPVLWHWVALSAWPPGSSLGSDGHPATGEFMPPTPHSRRMWLGASVNVVAPLIVGTEVVVERTVVDLVEKAGGSGSFAIATVTTDVSTTDGAPLLHERNQVAYRSPSPAATDDAPPRPVAQGASNPWFVRGDDGWRLSPDPVMLMRYSAITANGHRIHYDAPYVTEVEGYPNLLVHGPLIATMLAEAARRDNPDREVARFTCRAQRPFFLGATATITSTTDGGRVGLELRDDDAAEVAFMTAEVTLR